MAEAGGSRELQALARLGFSEAGGLPRGIREMHLGIAARAFDAVGPAAAPVRIAHDALASRAYGAVAAGAELAGRAAEAVIERGEIGRELELSRTPAGATSIAALNGLIGDALARSGSELQTPASVRIDGVVVAVEDDALRAAFPHGSDSLVVFLHGLMESEFHWWWGAEGSGQNYGGRLQDELGFTPVYVRYNSGLHISESGREVAALLEELLAHWPVPPRRVVLVGHSMGGLIARSAAHDAVGGARRWPGLVSHVVTLGTPHLGAPLAQGTHVLAAALNALPETRMFASLLRRRSAGIRDLRQGSLVDEDWRGRDPDALQAAACAEVPLLEGAMHCFVSATVTRSPEHPLGRMLGDTLVLTPSATGRGRRRSIPFDPANGLHVGGVHHFALLNHPQVYDRLREWLADDQRAAP